MVSRKVALGISALAVTAGIAGAASAQDRRGYNPGGLGLPEVRCYADRAEILHAGAYEVAGQVQEDSAIVVPRNSVRFGEIVVPRGYDIEYQTYQRYGQVSRAFSDAAQAYTVAYQAPMGRNSDYAERYRGTLVPLSYYMRNSDEVISAVRYCFGRSMGDQQQRPYNQPRFRYNGPGQR